jgi:hypothetical protein
MTRARAGREGSEMLAGHVNESTASPPGPKGLARGGLDHPVYLPRGKPPSRAEST